MEVIQFVISEVLGMDLTVKVQNIEKERSEVKIQPWERPNLAVGIEKNLCQSRCSPPPHLLQLTFALTRWFLAIP